VQGEDVVHDAVRQKELEAGLTGCIAGALQRFHDNDDVLWAALFCLAVLVRETSKVFHQVSLCRTAHSWPPGGALDHPLDVLTLWTSSNASVERAPLCSWSVDCVHMGTWLVPTL
jgi:hypothetical protein